jgi:hypothetical protein
MLKMTRRISLISEVEVDVINEELRGKISRRIPFALELGSGTSPREGYYHLDLVALPGIDIVADLNNGLDGIPDEIVSDLYSWHTLEHVTNFLHLMEEIHRVCLPNARVTIVVPHYSNGFGYSDPTHVRFFGLYSMSYFVAKDRQPFSRKVQDFYSVASFDLVQVRIEFYRMRGLFDKLVRAPFQWLVNSSIGALEFYERHLCRFFPARQLCFVMSPMKIDRSDLTGR